MHYSPYWFSDKTLQYFRCNDPGRTQDRLSRDVFDVSLQKINVFYPLKSDQTKHHTVGSNLKPFPLCLLLFPATSNVSPNTQKLWLTPCLCCFYEFPPIDNPKQCYKGFDKCVKFIFMCLDNFSWATNILIPKLRYICKS